MYKNSKLSPISFSTNAVHINGKPEIILSASLFYFRIPRALWRERMLQLKDYGYNCIDVYFPWNYHELDEGVWDFRGEKDIEAFMETAKEVGLWVMARPGPYICSEWDGGGLPAYLYTKADMQLRENNPAFLDAVSKWYAQVLPLLRGYQIDAGGTIICLQLENELDFYGCHDPEGYISALRNMAINQGITVPLIACAGQGGLVEASGFAEGVIPTCNFYPNDRDPVFESKVMHYRELLANRGLPLLVTETNRSHFLLRRLLSCGVKLLGPYLQVSGTNFGFTNGTNNWGSPLSFLTSDYDFGGMISPEGHIRPEAYEGLMLARLISAYSPSLAEAEPALEDPIKISSLSEGVVAGPQTLKLREGGYLAFISNVENSAAEVCFEVNNGAEALQIELILERWRSVALPFDVPLQTWGLEGTLMYATAELFMHKSYDSNTKLAFHTDNSGQIALRINEPKLINSRGLSVNIQDDLVILKFDNNDTAVCMLGLPDGRTLEIIVMDRETALLLENINLDGTLAVGQRLVYDERVIDLPISWTFSHIPAHQPLVNIESKEIDRADYLELHGFYRGYAWYESQIAVDTPSQGILIQDASDIVSLYVGDQYVATSVPGGMSRYIPLEAGLTSDRLLARVEIWGHSNFDDIRLPGLRLNAMKGLRNLVSVSNMINLTQNWKVMSVDERKIKEELIDPSIDDLLWPVVSFGGLLSDSRPALEYYRNSFDPSAEANAWIIHFDGLQGQVRIFIDGKDAGEANDSDPYVDITPFVSPGNQTQMTIFMELSPNSAAGKVLIYEGLSATSWRVSSAQEKDLWKNAVSKPMPVQTELPIEMDGGRMGWLLGKIADSNKGKGWRIKAEGSNMKLTVFFNGHLIGRLWLQGDRSSYRFTGGNGQSVYLPGVWFQDDSNKIAILLEAIGGELPSRLSDLSFVPVNSLMDNSCD